MLEYITTEWRTVKKRSGEVIMTGPVNWDRTALSAYSEAPQLSRPFISDGLEACVAVENMARAQAQTFAYVQSRLAATSVNESRVLAEQLKAVQKRFGSFGQKLYEAAQEQIYLSADPSIGAAVVQIAKAYQKMLDLLIADIKNSSTQAELLMGLRVLLEWVADAAPGFVLRLNQFLNITVGERDVGRFSQQNYRTRGSSGIDAAPF